MQRNLLLFAGLSGFSSVALGALGAHQLRDMLSPVMFNAFETGVRYQLFHTLALLGLVALPIEHILLKRAAMFFIIGIVLFSGSIYGLALSSLSGTIWSWLGPVTPLGGIALMTGWLFVILYALKSKS
jgi:uncharacterized membrane protein YgdD (TMEM256/DUF423 family)